MKPHCLLSALSVLFLVNVPASAHGGEHVLRLLLPLEDAIVEKMEKYPELFRVREDVTAEEMRQAFAEERARMQPPADSEASAASASLRKSLMTLLVGEVAEDMSAEQRAALQAELEQALEKHMARVETLLPAALRVASQAPQADPAGQSPAPATPPQQSVATATPAPAPQGGFRAMLLRKIEEEMTEEVEEEREEERLEAALRRQAASEAPATPTAPSVPATPTTTPVQP